MEDDISKDTNNDANDAFKESTWGKKIDGEFVIDGFKFRGRQPFKAAKEEMVKLMVKGRQSEVDGLKFKVLDAREKGIEIEVEVQIKENAKMGVDKTGVAML